MATEHESDTKRTSVNILPLAHRKALIATSLTGESLIAFVSKAVECKADRILKRHGVKLDVQSLSQAA